MSGNTGVQVPFSLLMGSLCYIVEELLSQKNSVSVVKHPQQ